MTPRTRFLGRLIGLYCMLASLAMVAHKQALVEMVTGLLHDPPVLFLAGLIAVIAGLAMVLGHNVWSGGALPVIVTLALRPGRDGTPRLCSRGPGVSTLQGNPACTGGVHRLKPVLRAVKCGMGFSL